MNKWSVVPVLLGCVFSCILTSGAAGAEAKDYDNARVLVIDHEKGYLGVSIQEEGTKNKRRFSFKVDLQNVDVADATNEPFKFSDIMPGDCVNITTITDSRGQETVNQIVDYGQPADAP